MAQSSHALHRHVRRRMQVVTLVRGSPSQPIMDPFSQQPATTRNELQGSPNEARCALAASQEGECLRVLLRRPCLSFRVSDMEWILDDSMTPAGDHRGDTNCSCHRMHKRNLRSRAQGGDTTEVSTVPAENSLIRATEARHKQG